jgi:hypothetical protein
VSKGLDQSNTFSGNKLKMMMKNRKRNKSMKKIALTGNFPQNGKQSDLG